MQEKPRFAIVEKIGLNGINEYRWGMELSPSLAAVFFENQPPLQLSQKEAYNKYLAIDEGLEDQQGIEVITWLDGLTALPNLKQHGKPNWIPETKSGGSRGEVFYTRFSSKTGLYTAFYGGHRGAVIELANQMAITSELRN